MEDWVRRLCEALDVPREAVDVGALLDLARDAAHHVDRPAAPVTTYLVGYAAALRGGSDAAVDEATRTASALAREWTPGSPA